MNGASSSGRWSVVILAAAACLSGASLLAAWSSQVGTAQPTVVATVDAMSVIDGLNEAKALLAEYKSRAEALSKKYKEGMATEQALKADLESLPRNDPAWRTKYLAYKKLQYANEADKQGMQAELDDAGGEIRRKLYLKVVEAVQKLAKTARYDLVLLDDQKVALPNEGSEMNVITMIVQKKILYRADHVDITNQVVLAMNNDYAAKR